jgi:hypothetical protein
MSSILVFLRYFPVFGVPRLPTIKAHKDRGQMVYMSPDGYYMGLVEGQSHRPSSSSPDLAPEQRCIRDMASVGVTARDDQGLINVGKSIWTR